MTGEGDPSQLSSIGRDLAALRPTAQKSVGPGEGGRPVLWGYGPSVYSRSVRLALHAAGMACDWEEVDPFEAAGGGPHPFGRVPVLRHGDVELFETAALLAYVEGVFGSGPADDPTTRARALQVGAIADHYAYRPLVRQVYVEDVSHRDGSANADALTEGMAAAPAVLDALDAIAAEGRVLVPDAPGTADWHLGPMIDAFFRYAPGAEMLATRPALARWWNALQGHATFRAEGPLREGEP